MRVGEPPLYRCMAMSGIMLIGILASDPASADTLRQAFAAAYRNNPTIDAQRAVLRALDESVAIARSGYRPSVSASAGISMDKTTASGGPATDVISSDGRLVGGDDGTTRTATYGISLSQPIFTGMRTTNGVRAAEAAVRAGRERLRSAEQGLFLSVLAAYNGILAAQSNVRTLQIGVRNATRELQRTRRRLKLQETTRTDLAQAEAVRTEFLAGLDAAKGSLRTAQAAYYEVTGQRAGRLRPATVPLNQLPTSLQQAITISKNENPDILSALYDEQGARHAVDIARGALLPSAGVSAGYSRTKDIGGGTTSSTSVSANLTVPIYSGGANHAAVRQAKQLHVSALQSVASARSRIQLAVTTAWTELQVAKRRVGYIQLQIKANKAAIRGLRKEETIGQRTLNDVIGAERNLLNVKLELIEAKNQVVATSYGLLATIGRLDPETYLPANSAIYDPEIHYHDVRRRWFGLSITYSDGRNEKMIAKTK